jgi:hypothetical protein
MKKNVIDKLADSFPAINKLIAGILAIYSLCIGIYKGIVSDSTPEFFGWAAIGFVGALLILFTFLALDFGLSVWDKSTNWLSKHIRKYPYIRLWATFPVIIFAFYAAYFVLKDFETDLSLRVFISVYLIWVLPAAITSLIRDDLSKERARLSKEVSREIRIQNPQAAIANAFTHFEDHLLKRLSGDSKLYGNKLIKAAYEGEKSKLVFKFDGKDYTVHLNNLISGAYSIFRNPRHHKIIEDDEQKAQAIISLAELLIEFVDASEERILEQDSESQKPAT